MDSTNFIEEIEAQFILRVLVKYWPEGILSHFHIAWGKFCTVTLFKYQIQGVSYDNPKDIRKEPIYLTLNTVVPIMN